MTTIKQAREALGLTQNELANNALMTSTTISRLENGHPVSKATLKRVCIALNVNPSDIEGVVLVKRTPKLHV